MLQKKHLNTGIQYSSTKTRWQINSTKSHLQKKTVLKYRCSLAVTKSGIEYRYSLVVTTNSIEIPIFIIPLHFFIFYKRLIYKNCSFALNCSKRVREL